jgi:hypothetical protein
MAVNLKSAVKKENPMLKSLVTIFAAVLFLSFCAQVFAQEPAKSEAPADKEYRAIDALKAKGFNTCAGTASSVLKFLHKNDDFAFLNTWNAKATDAHAAQIFTVKPYTDGKSYASVTTSQRADGGCDASFTQVFFFTENCAKMRDTTFKEWKFYMDLGGVPVYEDPTSKTVVITLAPTGNGCLILKSGSFYFAPKAK